MRVLDIAFITRKPHCHRPTIALDARETAVLIKDACQHAQECSQHEFSDPWFNKSMIYKTRSQRSYLRPPRRHHRQNNACEVAQYCQIHDPNSNNTTIGEGPGSVTARIHPGKQCGVGKYDQLTIESCTKKFFSIWVLFQSWPLPHSCCDPNDSPEIILARYGAFTEPRWHSGIDGCSL
ncbi:hypothetical protein K504DRAFT_18697 [Pleomassaria siparia CBS 279.74]|uniref:Uncharacterized protein n=1 Tax=Pleomassaria siparia CBS 279.74 TaxID=1314801 RepID=A0A6G1KRJ8_9PLEO|nr:hypothetical protein K504DRAFT_18697 [Pleomassaria siparia CBS 279.74]